MEEGKKIIAVRQKYIKIADCSELGWSVISEYEADELATDSDDEKRIEKAEKSAEKKALKRKKQRAEPSSKQSRPERSSGIMAGREAIRPLFPNMSALYSPPAKRSNSFPARQVVGPCYQCNEFGHLRRNCPKLNMSTAKWYPCSEENYVSVSKASTVHVPCSVAEGHMQKAMSCSEAAGTMHVIWRQPPLWCLLPAVL